MTEKSITREALLASFGALESQFTSSLKNAQALEQGFDASRAKLVQAKQATDLHTSTLSQMAAYEVVKDGFLDTHIPTIRKLYSDQCQAMLAALSRHMPEGVRWNTKDLNQTILNMTGWTFDEKKQCYKVEGTYVEDEDGPA